MPRYVASRVADALNDHGVALRVEDIAWAGRQLWSNDAAFKDGTYYRYGRTPPSRCSDACICSAVPSNSRPRGDNPVTGVAVGCAVAYLARHPEIVEAWWTSVRPDPAAEGAGGGEAEGEDH